MTRRHLLSAALGAPALLAKPNHIGRSRISAITDEIARSPADAIAFAKQYSLQWLELRDVPGRKGTRYSHLPEADLQTAAREFKEGGVRISFLNTGLLKFTLPGTEPVRRREETPEARQKRLAQEQKQFDNRMEDLAKSIRAAHILGTVKVRVFGFMRVAQPETLFPRIADILGEMTKVAERERVQLLIENEASCNVGTCAELAAILKAVPSRALGLNWDPLNGHSLKERIFPEGYAALPKKRIGNVQIKGKSILPGYEGQLLDWAGIFRALEKDGYQGEVGLETHIFGETQVAESHASMKAILGLVATS